MTSNNSNDDQSLQNQIATSPIGQRDQNDPGDEVLRKFRYQFAYGVILLIAAATKGKNYKAIWCEQHEDLLAEIEDDLFDAYQVKTRKPEIGKWDLNDEALWKSIGRFVDLHRIYKKNIQSFKFVSNTEFSDSSASGKEHLSPLKLMTSVQAAQHWDELSDTAKKGFELLKDKISSTSEELFSVLKKLDLVLGPTEAAFDDEISQRHLSTLTECSTLSASALRGILDVLIAKVGKASSLSTNAPSKHWIALNRDLRDDPFLSAKCITVEDFKIFVNEARGSNFKYLEMLASLDIGKASTKMDTLEIKMSRGGLANHFEMMRRRALSAEQILIDLATRPEDGRPILSQIENAVFGICDDVYLRASQLSSPYGAKMLIDVQDQLKQLAQQEPERVHRQSYDLLFGVAGLLTEACKVWWSGRFQLEEKQ